MGRFAFRLPDIGEGVAEAEIVAWRVKVGDQVSEDQELVDVMTDKATVDISSPIDGTIVAVHGEVGSLLPVGSVLVEFEVDGDTPEDEQAAPVTEAPAPAETTPPPPPVAKALAPAPAPAKAAATTKAPAFATRAPGDAPMASPATRRRAHEMGIPLQYVPATGPGGRITPEDLDDYIASSGANGTTGDSRYAVRSGVDETRIIGLRRKIAEKMQDAKRRIPHIAYVEEADVTELEALRLDLNAHRGEDRPKLTLLPFLIRAMVRVLPDFLHINARFDDDAGVLNASAGVHVGIATQTPAGLMVPVVRHAESLDLYELAHEIVRLSKAARDGSAAREELSGSTITITSLGPLGGIASTPVINHPEVAIIGPNKIVERPVMGNGYVTVRKMMNLSCSFDHRIVDGYDAALFVQQMKRVIEHPALIFID